VQIIQDSSRSRRITKSDGKAMSKLVSTNKILKQFREKLAQIKY